MKQESGNSTISLLGIVWTIGFIVIVPLIGFALLGRLADRAVGSSPLFFLVGVVVAIIASTVLIYRKTSQLMAAAERSTQEEANTRTNV